MLDAHHYTAEGLSLLPVGTPTNNTEAAARVTSTDDADEAFPIERGASLVSSAGATAAGWPQRWACRPTSRPHPRRERHGRRRLAPRARRSTARPSGTPSRSWPPGWSRWTGASGCAFVTGSVSARGLLPALRVADEPYGVLPISALSRFVPDQRDARLLNATQADNAPQGLFDTVLLGVLRQMHADWTRLRAPVKHAHSPDVGRPGYDAQQHFLQMLGLQATSVAASYRFGVNVADRGGVRGHPELSLSFGIPKAGEQTRPTVAQFGPYALMERFARPLAAAFGIPDTALRGPAGTGGGIAEHWQDVYGRLTEARAYQLRYLFGIKPLRGAVARDDAGTGGSSGSGGAGGSGAATSTAALLAADYLALADRALHSSGAGVPLAQMLMRHALLAEGRRAAVRILFREGMLNDATYAWAASSSTYDWTTITRSIPCRPGAFCWRASTSWSSVTTGEAAPSLRSARTSAGRPWLTIYQDGVRRRCSPAMQGAPTISSPSTD